MDTKVTDQKHVNLYFAEQLWERAAQYARTISKTEGYTSVSEVIRKALAEYLAARGF